VKFVPQPTDDETFAQYVADEKNISLASSKYFVEKFITKLREDASKGKYLFADLGSFQTDLDQLVFKPNDRIPADPAFYGYPIINLLKVGQPISFDTKQPEFAQTQAAAIPLPQQGVAGTPQAVAQPQYFEDDVEHKRGISIWLIILFAVVAIAVAVFAVFKFSPSTWDKVKTEYHKITGKPLADSPAVKQEAKKDTQKKIVPMHDTIAKTVTPPPVPVPAKDTVAHIRYEIQANNYRQMGWANKEVTELKRLGLNAKILTDAPGPRIKVSAGTFYNLDSAETARKELIKERKIPSNSKVIPFKIN
jgi:cell division protein FtsN